VVQPSGIRILQTGRRFKATLLRRIWVSWWMKNLIQTRVCTCSLEGQLYLGRIKREAAAGRGRELSMPILFSVRPHLEFCIQAWSPQLKEEVEVLEQVCRRPWRWSEGWSTFPVEKGWGSWACLGWRREGSKRSHWMWLWAGGKCPCQWQGVRTGWSLSSLPTQAILWVYDSVTYRFRFPWAGIHGVVTSPALDT